MVLTVDGKALAPELYPQVTLVRVEESVHLPDYFAIHLDDPHFELTAEFCERYDQASFDPDYPTESIDVFEPMVRRMFAEPRYLPPGWV